MLYLICMLVGLILVLLKMNYNSEKRNRQSLDIAKDYSTKLVKLTQKNYLLRKRCGFYERQLNIDMDVKDEQYDLEEILDEINQFGIDKLSKDKLNFLKFGDHNKK